MKLVQMFSTALLAAACSLAVPVIAAPVLEFQPGTLNFNAGDTVNVTVQVAGLGTEIVSAYDLDVAYNAAILDAVGVTFSNNLGDPGLLETLQDFNLLAGVVDFAEISLLSDADLATLQAPLSGTVPLAVIQFTALQAGDLTALAFSLPPGNDVKGANNQVIITGIAEPDLLGLLAAAGLAAWLSTRRKITT